jgi:phosphinothricin acetyltransferase
VRDAVNSDASSIADIYNYEMKHGASHYSESMQSAKERLQWLKDLRKKNYPVVVAEAFGKVVGFVALTPFHPLGGYRFTVTGSIYVHPEFRRSRVGKALGEAILEKAHQNHFHSIIAGVNSRNTASIALLESFGFQKVGYFREIGFKNEMWFDDVCLQLIINKGEK